MPLRDDVWEKSMVGQVPNSVRLPFGPPNAYQHRFEDPHLTQNREYRKQYQKQIREVQIDTVDWRIDPKFNSNLNNYVQNHQPEDDLGKIGRYHAKKCG
jgi:hypothetical protein